MYYQHNRNRVVDINVFKGPDLVDYLRVAGMKLAGQVGNSIGECSSCLDVDVDIHNGLVQQGKAKPL